MSNSFNGLSRKLAQMPQQQGLTGMGMTPGPVSPPPQAGVEAPQDMGGMNPPADPSQDGQQYTLSSLISEINADPQATMQKLRGSIPDQQVTTSDGQNVGASTLLDAGSWQTADEAKKGEIAGLIMEALPPNMKADSDQGSEGENNAMNIPVKQENVQIAAAVNEANAVLMKLAKQMASQNSNTPKTFNLNKSAQSRVGQGNVVFGPSHQYFPSVNQIGNDWHIEERNKGWGLKAHEFPGIDYEMVWRKNVMDKYFREYKDEKGNWVGGYINKRFEVDKNIPEINNMQLKPGEVRKPFVPEYHLLEARLEAAREKEGVEGAKVFNWRKAQSDALKKKITAQGYQPQSGPLDAKPLPKTQRTCPQCGATIAGNTSVCDKCGGSFNPSNAPAHVSQPRPYQPGEQTGQGLQAPTHIQVPKGPVQVGVVPPNQRFINRNKKTRIASIPKDDKENSDDDEDDKEFKQLLSGPEVGNQVNQTSALHEHADFLRQAIHAKDKKNRSFSFLCGDPNEIA